MLGGSRVPGGPRTRTPVPWRLFSGRPRRCLPVLGRGRARAPGGRTLPPVPARPRGGGGSGRMPGAGSSRGRAVASPRAFAQTAARAFVVAGLRAGSPAGRPRGGRSGRPSALPRSRTARSRWRVIGGGMVGRLPSWQFNALAARILAKSAASLLSWRAGWPQ